ncbi:LPS biosynthesis protein [Brevundimonas sp. Root1423]|nr:LPS biosynthesis protein [Brevundimonas sp. Root1423]
MDTSDPNIAFGDDGVCEYCTNFHEQILPTWSNDNSRLPELMNVAEKIKADSRRRNREFDCIIGLSGGLDSSYAAYVAVRVMGLKPLLYHVDAGWNTDQAVGNIERLVEGLGLDLYTDVINWKEMADLQVAFLKSQIADQDMPQDGAFFSSLYKYARANKIKYVLTGANYSTECCREPEEWGAYPGIDKTLFHDIHNRFGQRKLKTFPLVDIIQYKIIDKYLYGMTVVKPLNYVRYVKSEVEEMLGREFGWQKFEHKHHESRFTRFYEDYWMPRKFGFEKRRAHFSSLIMTGQLDRAEALKRLRTPVMTEQFLAKEFDYVASKLDLRSEQLREIFEGPNRTFRDYRNKRFLIGIGANMMRLLGLEKRLFR